MQALPYTAPQRHIAGGPAAAYQADACPVSAATYEAVPVGDDIPRVDFEAASGRDGTVTEAYVAAWELLHAPRPGFDAGSVFERIALRAHRAEILRHLRRYPKTPFADALLSLVAALPA